MLATLFLAALTGLPAAQAQQPGAKAEQDEVKKLELFSGEDWYRKQQAKEEDFHGVLSKVEQGKAPGIGRFNPYRMEYNKTETIITFELVPVKMGDEVVMEPRQVPVTNITKVTREVYVAGKDDILAAFVGKNIKLMGKAVTMEVEGKSYQEIWPARVELWDGKLPEGNEGPPKTPQPPPGGDKKDKQPEAKKDLPTNLEVLANEDWYRKLDWKEQTVAGVITKVKPAKPKGGGGKGGGSGGSGGDRFNPYRLVVEPKIGGGYDWQAPGAQVRELYVAGKDSVLDVYVGRRVLVSGVWVTLEFEGRRQFEIWPGFIVLAEKKEIAPKIGGQEMQVKIHAKTAVPFVSTDPDSDKKGKQVVLRSAADLQKNWPQAFYQANKEEEEKKATAALAKLFKVDTIDWKKQMVVVITAGVKPTGGYTIDITSIKSDGKQATVNWKLDPPAGIAIQVFTDPSVMALVGRVEGDVTFNPPLK